MHVLLFYSLTPAMTEGCALNHFRAAFPRRFFDVGIAEEHMLTFAAGQAAGGLRPIACVYSTFLQRAMDQSLPLRQHQQQDAVPGKHL